MSLPAAPHPESSSSPTGRPGLRRWLPWLLGAGVLGGGWHWGLSQGLPQWLPGKVWPVLAQELGTPVRWQQLEVHPWTLQVTLRGLQVGPDAQPLLAVRAITVQPSWETVWRLAPVLRRVTVDGPVAHISRDAPGQFNFSPLIAHWQQRHPPKPEADTGEPARFAVFNIAVNEGAVFWRDQVLGQQHRVDQLHLGVPFVSNLPSFVDAEVQPALSARVDGSELKLDGDTLPFQQGRRSQLHLRWQQVSVPQLVEAVQPFLPAAWRPVMRGGTLGSDLTLHFEAHTAPALPRLAVTGSVVLDGLDLALPQLALPPLPGGVPLSASLAWKRLALSDIDAQPLLQQAHVGEVSLEGVQAAVLPAVNAAVQPVPSPQRVGAKAEEKAEATAQAQAAAAKSAAAPAKPWDWSVGKVRAQVQTLAIQPWAPQPGLPAWPRIEGLEASVQGLRSGAAAPPANWTLSWRDSAGGSVSGKGQAHVVKAEVSAQLQWQGLALADWAQGPMHALALPVRLSQGDLAGRLNVSWGPGADGAPAAALRWEAGELHVSELLAAPVDKVSPSSPASSRGVKTKAIALPANHLAWRALDLMGLQGRWSPPSDVGKVRAARAKALSAATPASAQLPEIQIQNIRWQGLDVALVREADNRWFGLPLHATDAAGVPNTSAASGASASVLPPGLPHITLGRWQCEACRLMLDDRSVAPATRLALGPFSASVQGLDTARPGDPLRFDVDSRVLDSGRLQAQGQLRLQPLSADTQLKLAAVQLKVLQPYLDPYVNVVLTGAEPELDGRLRWQAATARQPQQLRYAGRLGVRAMSLQDRVNAADFLSWKRLSLDSTELAMLGDQLDAKLGRIQLDDFYGRIIVNPDGRLNLASILRSERGGATTSVTTPQATGPTAPAAQAASASSAAKAGNTAAPRLAWQQVRLNGGRVDFTDHFIQPNYSAKLTQVQGDVSAVSSQQAEPATVSISGAVDDAAPLRISGRLQPLGPQLFTDIEGSAKGIELTRLTPYAARYAGYGIDKGTLSVNVHYKVDQGKLEASNRIFLDQLTFGARSDSPDAIKLPIQFAVSLLKNARGEIDVNLPISGSLSDPQFSVGGIIWQVVVNLITKAVTAPFSLLAGDGGEDWGHAPFDAGSAELNATAIKRLEGLAKSLADRPALKLEATGHADPVSDAAALRQAHVDRLMRAAKARATGQPLPEVRIAVAEQDSWLTAAYKAADLPNKPRNALGLAKTLPPAEMKQLLLASAPASEAALRELANARADQVKAFLAARIAPERILLTASQLDGGAKGGEGEALPPARVQMALR
jgi:hypothetical protein